MHVDAVPSEAETLELCRSVRRGMDAKNRLAETGESLSRRERGRLGVDVRAGAYAEGALVRGHARLVAYLVAKVSKELPGARVDADDALQAGTLGFLDAIRRFDPERGVRLSTFAAYYVRELVLRLHRDAPMLSGAYGGDLHVGLKRYAEYLEGTLGRRASPEELSELWNRAVVARYGIIESGRAGAEGLSPEEIEARAEKTVRSRGLWLGPERVAQVMARNETVVSLSAPVRDDDGAGGGEAAEDLLTSGISAEDEVIDAMERSERRERVSRAVAVVLERLDGFSPNMGTVVSWYFGLGGNPPLGVPLIAEGLGLKVSEVNEMLEAALEIMGSYKELREVVGAAG